MRAMVLLAAALGMGAAAPARLTPEQAKLLRERDALWARSLAAWETGRRGEAVAGLEKALAGAEAMHGPWHRETEEVLHRLSVWERARGRAAQATAYRTRMLRSEAALDPRGHWIRADARVSGGTLIQIAGMGPVQMFRIVQAIETEGRIEAALREARWKEFLPTMLHLSKTVRDLLGEKHPYYADTLGVLSHLHHGLGDHQAALPLCRKSLAIKREMLGERHPSYANTLNSLASLHEAMGDCKAALPLHRQALAINQEALGERHPHSATCLSALAGTFQAMGDCKAALPLYKQALAIYKEALGEKHPQYAVTLGSLASLHEEMGDYKAALPLYEQALAICKETLGERHPNCADLLNNLAILHKMMENRKAALPLYEKALAINKEVRGEKHPAYATNLSNLALLHTEMRNFKAALPLSRLAIAIRKEVLGEKHPDYATSLLNLAYLHHATGDLKAALPLHRQAVAIKKEALGERHLSYANSLNNLAVLLSAMGDRKAALPLYEKALAIVATHLADLASAQSDRQQLAAADTVCYYLHNRLDLPDLPGHPTAASHALAWKGSLLLREQQRRLFLRLSADPAAREAAARLQQATRALAALRLSPATAKSELGALEKEQETAQAALASLSAAFREAREKDRPSPDSLAAALPEGAVLVDYCFYGSQLAAFVHRRGKPAARIDLGKAAPVEEAVNGWRAQLVRGKPDGAFGAALKKLVYSPLQMHLGGAKVVLVSPDGALGTVPFAALPGKKEGTYLVEDVAVAVVPVPSAVLELLAPARKDERLPPSLLVAADLRYDPGEKGTAPPAGEDSRAAPRSGREKFPRLPATGTEALAVQAAFAKLFKGGKATVLAEDEATKAAVRKALAGVRYAHLATHGWFAPETVRSAVTGEGKERAGERREPVGWHPLLLSGLALSDANRDPKPGEEDGILTALEVSEMDLTKLELAVLSACETGLGKAAGGEGLLGMQRAFAVAGARSVVSSLWKVDDRATQRLMGDFYAAAWDPKAVVSRAEALRQAQLSMLREGKRRGVGKDAAKLPEGGERLPPFYWAAFVLSGDWR